MAQEVTLIALGAVIGGILGEIARRVALRVWLTTIDPRWDRMSKARQRARHHSEVLAGIAEHFAPNGGLSLPDRIKAIEADVAGEEHTHDQITALLREVKAKQDWVLETLGEMTGKAPDVDNEESRPS